MNLMITFDGDDLRKQLHLYLVEGFVACLTRVWTYVVVNH